jgi:hypothetical protein
MFATISSLLPLSAAAAGEAPVISLNLNEQANLQKLDHAILRNHDLGLTQPNGKVVGSRQDYVQRCDAGANTDAQNCALPSAKAFDHQEGALKVTQRIFLVDLNSEKMNKEVKTVDFTKRSTYLFKFDAADSAGNNAEQIVFGLVLDDLTAPVITPCYKLAERVEAASTWEMCSTSKAVDNIDGDLSKSLKYTVSHKGEKLCSECGYTEASNKITTIEQGLFTVSLSSSDKAGMYGKGAANNVGQSSMVVNVMDTLPPKITVAGANPATHECALKVYGDNGATAIDQLDSKLGKGVAVVTTSNVNGAKMGSYTVTYNAKDSTGNKAIAKTRAVNVVDKTAPVLKLQGHARIEHVAGTAFADPGVQCKDACTTSKIHTPVWTKPFTDQVLGDYVRTYKCSDTSSNTATVSRTFTVVDKTAPLLALIGEDSITIEAGSSYTEQGATCKDFIDGDISKKVKVAHKIKIMEPGTYNVVYSCTDSSGNSAPTQTRKVVVKDTTCPVVKLTGQNVVKIEAGFAYKDSGATASDSLDGTLTEKITTTGDSVDTMNAFKAQRSCAEIKKRDPKAKTANYFITNSLGKRVKVWCDMDTSSTYFACDGCMSVVPYKKNGTGEFKGSCPAYGLVMAESISKAALQHFGQGKEESKWFPKDKTAKSNAYLCTVPAVLKHSTANHDYIRHEDIAHAEQGKYIINYHVQDKAGNKECKTLHRTVIVVDTLPPVISLKFRDQLIHMSDHSKVGIGGEANPAGTAAGNPYIDRNDQIGLMQIATQHSGWTVAAIASAVAGVALFASSMKQSAPVSVPV